jgi:branched-chain amino acid transport system substrate-binding protein
VGKANKIGTGGVVVLGMLIAAACSSSSGSTTGNSGGGSSSKDSIVIGTSVSLTGKYASNGTNLVNGYKLAVAQINKNGGVLGRTLELKVQDDQSDAGTVGRIYTKFLTSDKVDALVSPYGSALAGPAAQLADRYKTPMAHSQTSSPNVFKGTKYNVLAGIAPSSKVLSEVPAFAKANGYTKLTLVNNDLDAYSQICDGTAAAIPGSGTTLVSRVSYSESTSDFSSTALKIKQDNPDVVVECSAIQDTIGLTRALNQQGFRPKVVISATSEDPTFAQALGSLANKAMGYSIYSPALDRPGASTFESDYQSTYHTAANGQSAAAYATVQALAAAIAAAGSTDHDAVNEQLHTGSFQTIVGTYKVDSDGVQTGYEPVLDQYQNGKLELVWPQSSASKPVELPY